MKFIVFISPDDPENGKGSILICEWDEKKKCPSNEVLKKEFSIDMQSDPHSLIIEGEEYFKKHKKEIIKELEDWGYSDISFSFA